MPLSPQARTYLEEVASLGLPPLWEITPSQARENMRAMAREMAPGETVARVEKLQVPGPGGALAARLYRPRVETPAPLVVFFHGGGWVLGDLDTHDSICHCLALTSDSLVMSVDYRLAPESKFPASAEDAYAATVWAHREAMTLGADPHRIAVAGDSAGGNLAAVVALMARDRGGPTIALQVLIYPITNNDFETPSYRQCAEGYGLTRAAMIWFWDQYVSTPQEAEHPYASPLRAPDVSGLPPALVITAEYDPLRDEGESYSRRLHEAGVPTRLRRYDGAIHGFYRQTARFDDARNALTETAAALRSIQSVVDHPRSGE